MHRRARSRPLAGARAGQRDRRAQRRHDCVGQLQPRCAWLPGRRLVAAAPGGHTPQYTGSQHCSNSFHRSHWLHSTLPAALLVETNTPLEPEQLRGALEAMLSCGEAHPALGAVMRTVVQLTQLDGPLRMLGEPSSYGDLPTLQQHLSLLIGQLNMLHDPAALGSFVRSPSFHRAKYELFALHHLQLLVSPIPRVLSPCAERPPSTSSNRSMPRPHRHGTSKCK